MAIMNEPVLEPMVGDPDDHRPHSMWAIVIDPPQDGSVEDIVVIAESIAPGDRIPLHTHTTSEVIVVGGGEGISTLGDDERVVRAGSIVFIPAGTPHGTRNTSSEPLRLHAMFPARVIDITYLDRNPEPGTEGDAPQPPIVFDPRTT